MDCNRLLSENDCAMKLQSKHVAPRLNRLLLLLFLLACVTPAAMSQSSYTIFGDVKIDDSKAVNPGPSSVTVILYDQSTKIVGRQTISNRGRYRFANLRGGEYDLAIEAD